MFNKNYIIKGELICETGLHIGGSNDNIEIGGADSNVIRDSIDDLPFIPGSSLKGKLRNLLELNDEEIYENVKQNDGKPSNEGSVAKLFGKSSDKSDYNINNVEITIYDKIKELEDRIKRLELGVIENQEENQDTKKDKKSDSYVKLIIRDSYPTDDTIKLWKKNFEIVNGTELKYENTINRIKGDANPRNIERVPPQSKFSFEIIFGIYDDPNEKYAKEVYQLLSKGLKLLQDDYLGGSGSRGSGRVQINNKKLVLRDKKYYETENAKEKLLDW